MNHGLRTISGKIYGHTTVNTRIFLSVYSILGRGFFCFNYCLNLAWNGGDQFVALLR